MAVAAGNRKDQELDIVLMSTKDGKVIRNLTERLQQGPRLRVHRHAGRLPRTTPCRGCRGRRPAIASPTSRAPRSRRRWSSRTCVTSKIEKRIDLKTVDMPESPDISPDGKEVAFAGAARRRSPTSSSSNLETGEITQPHERPVRRLRADLGARRQVDRLPGARQRQRQAVPPRPRTRGKKTQLTFGTHDDGGGAVHRRRHDRVPVDGHRSESADRSRGGAQRQHLQHLDAEPEERRAEAVHRRARRQRLADRAAATRSQRRSPSSPTTRVSTASTRCRANEPLHTVASADFGSPGPIIDFTAAAQPHAGQAERSRRRASSRSCSSRAVRRSTSASPAAATSSAAPRSPSPTCSATSSSTSSPRRSRSTARCRSRTLNLSRRFQYALQGFSQTQFYYGNDPACSTIRSTRIVESRATRSRRRPRAAARRSPSTRSTATRGSSCRRGMFQFKQAVQRRRAAAGRATSTSSSSTAARCSRNGTIMPFGAAYVQRDDGLPRVRAARRAARCALGYEYAPPVGGFLSRQTARRRRALLHAARRPTACSPSASAASRAGATSRATCTSAATPNCAATTTWSSSATRRSSPTPSCGSR